MILVMSGTEDGKEIVKRLYQKGCKLITSVATGYGRSIFERMGLGDICIHGRLDKDQLARLIEDKQIDMLIDATHPYAVNASLNAIEACKEKDIRYIRFQRDETPLPASLLIHRARNMDEAISRCDEVGQRIMLTTGFNNLNGFRRLFSAKEIIVRILPIPDHIKGCIEMGIVPANIIAMQGPFSIGLNKAVFHHFKIDTMVTKDSGMEGGVVEKVQAAIDEGINVVLIDRPDVDYPCVYSSIDEMFVELFKSTQALKT